MNWAVPLTEVILSEEDVDAVLEVMRSGWLTMGPQTEQFEAALAAYMGASHAVAVSSGSAALHLSCLAAEIGSGDEVIVPALTFVSTVSAVIHAGGTPVFCDVLGPDDLNLDPDDVRRRITARTKAVIAVHLGGYAAELAELRRLCDEHGLVLIEDCAQAIGARAVDGRAVGTVGELGCYSFFSKEQLSIGEGGLLISSDPDTAARVRLLRSHGLTTSSWDRHRGHGDSYDVIQLGFNYRLDEARAALGLSRLRRLDHEISERRRLAAFYRAQVADTPGVSIPWTDDDVSRSSHFAFFVLLPDEDARDDFRAALREDGVQTTQYPAVHWLTAYRALAPTGGLPRTEEVARRHCALPMSSMLDERRREIVVDAVRRARSSQRYAPAS
jgi:dTDP-4-amino-4,6-dideoxygalactose transaminase